MITYKLNEDEKKRLSLEEDIVQLEELYQRQSYHEPEKTCYFAKRVLVDGEKVRGIFHYRLEGVVEND